MTDRQALIAALRVSADEPRESCRKTWPTDPGNWCGDCLRRAAADALEAAEQERARRACACDEPDPVMQADGKFYCYQCSFQTGARPATLEPERWMIAATARKAALEAAEQERARLQDLIDHLTNVEMIQWQIMRREAAESQVATLTAQLAHVREALGRTTAMCRAATTWTSDDIQGLRYHALEAARTGMEALTPPAPSTGETSKRIGLSGNIIMIDRPSTGETSR